MSGASKRACRPHFSALLMRGAFLGAFASTAPAHAWQGNAAGPEQASQAARTASGGIADIVVTARRRSESLQNTPVAVSAIDRKSVVSGKSVSVSVDLGGRRVIKKKRH